MNDQSPTPPRPPRPRRVRRWYYVIGLPAVILSASIAAALPALWSPIEGRDQLALTIALGLLLGFLGVTFLILFDPATWRRSGGREPFRGEN